MIESFSDPTLSKTVTVRLCGGRPAALMAFRFIGLLTNRLAIPWE